MLSRAERMLVLISNKDFINIKFIFIKSLFIINTITHVFVLNSLLVGVRRRGTTAVRLRFNDVYLHI